MLFVSDANISCFLLPSMNFREFLLSLLRQWPDITTGAGKAL